MSSANDPTATDWLARRRRLDALLRLQAAVMVGDPGHVEAVNLLAEALGDREADVRELAAPALIQSLSHPAPEVRAKTAHLLGTIGSPAAEAQSALQALLTDPDESIRTEAAEALRQIVTA